LLAVANFTSNSCTRLDHMTRGKSEPKFYRQQSTTAPQCRFY